MSSDQRQKYRDITLREHTESGFRSETIDVVFGDQKLEVEVQALPIDEFSDAYVPEKLIDELGAEMALKVALVTKCSFIPGTDERIWNPPASEDNPGDVWRLAEWPMSGRGPIERLYEAVNYVHDFQIDPPEGIQDPRLQEMQEAAERLARIAETASQDDDEDIHPGEVKEVAESIAERIRWIDHGSVSGK